MIDPARLAEINLWVTKAGLRGTGETDLLLGFCRRVQEAGMPVSRAMVFIDTLHPVHEGRLFTWQGDRPSESEMREYGRTNQGGQTAEGWRRSPHYAMLQADQAILRRRLDAAAASEFPVFADLVAKGQTEYLALIQKFNEDSIIGEMDGIYSSWTTDDPAGFSDEEAVALKRLVPSLALAIKAASLGRIAETLVETYLGRDAGRRVLSGKIERGVADPITAAIWFSDLRGYTRITDTCPPESTIPLLNDYADAVISSVEEAGGDVLKLIGDGTLAIFTHENLAQACRCALAAERTLRDRISVLNARRNEEGVPVTSTYLALHLGRLFYGNVGSRTRLDFTVVGPAVNEASRIATMCRSVERDVLISTAFRDAAEPDERDRMVSVGRYALRGVARPTELYTLDLDSALTA